MPALSYRFLPEVRELEELRPEDDELRDVGDAAGRETLCRPEEEGAGRAAGLLLLSRDGDDTPLLRPPDEREVDEFLPDVTARPSEAVPDRGLVKSIEGVLPVGALRPVTARPPSDGARAPAVLVTEDLVVPDDRAPS